MSNSHDKLVRKQGSHTMAQPSPARSARSQTTIEHDLSAFSRLKTALFCRNMRNSRRIWLREDSHFTGPVQVQ